MYVQLDEDADAKHLVRACQSEGHVLALRFPKRLRSADDTEVIQKLLPRGNAILTMDERFAADHVEHIADLHPGIVIVALDDDDVRTMTTYIAQQILNEFKQQFPEWHNVSSKNSIVRVTPQFVEIAHVQSQTLVTDGFFDRSDAGWQEKLTSLLDLRSSRG